MKVLSDKSKALFGLGASYRIAIGLIVALGSGAFLTSVSKAQLAPDPTSSETDAVDAALEASLGIVMSQPPYPKNATALEAAVQVVFSALYPDLAIEELQKNDPTYNAAEAAAFANLGHPEAVEAELHKNAQANRDRQNALEGLTQGVAESKAAYLKAVAAQLATLKDPKEVDAETRNNPAWREQREAPIRALAPGYSQATKNPAP